MMYLSFSKEEPTVNFQEYKKEAFAKDPELYKEYKALEAEYEIIRQVISARGEKKFDAKAIG